LRKNGAIFDQHFGLFEKNKIKTFSLLPRNEVHPCKRSVFSLPHQQVFNKHLSQFFGEYCFTARRPLEISARHKSASTEKLRMNSEHIEQI
jgi:hypothetical protein